MKAAYDGMIGGAVFEHMNRELDEEMFALSEHHYDE